MTALLDKVIAAHSGDLWAKVKGLTLDLEIGGNILATKFKSPFPRYLQAEITTTNVNISLAPFPTTGLKGTLTSNSLTISTDRGETRQTRPIMRLANGKVPVKLIWDDLDLLYFIGYALWNYVMTPSYFLWPGFNIQEQDPWQEPSGAVWQVLKVTYPLNLPTHCPEQLFYFNDQGLLQRLDYTADVFGSIAQGAHYCYQYRNFQGLWVPTQRVVYLRLPSRRPLKLFSVMQGRINNVTVHWQNRLN